MRFFALIVGVLVLYLSTVPCCTGEDMCKDGEVNMLETSDMAEDSDLEFPCSPFLSCGSCAGFNLEKQLALKFDPLLISFRTDEFFFSMCQSNGYHFLLIKPPVLASA
jgi:hypothetical protein